MSCRYPEAYARPKQLWQLLVDGTDAISAFPDRPRLEPR